MRKFCALLFACVAVPLAASELVFAVGQWSPYVGERLPGYGYAARVVAAACGAAGLKARFEFYPWIRAEQRVADGLAFGTFPFVAVREREANFIFSDVLIESSVGILRSAASDRTRGFAYSGEPSRLAGFTVGTTSGGLAVTVPLRAAGVSVEETETVDQSIAKLERGRIDFVIDERAVIIDSLRRTYPRASSQFAFVQEDFLIRREYRLIVSRRHPDARLLLDRFNAGLASIRADGSFERIRRDFGL